VRLTRIGQQLSGWPRRLLALACLLLAALSAVHTTHSVASPVTATVDVVVAAHDLAAGAVIEPADVRVARWPATLRSAAALSTAAAAVGRRLAGAVGSGELITSTRLVGGNLTAGLAAGLIAVPVPLVDPGAASLIEAGDHVDLLSPPSDTTPQAVMVAAGVLVLAVVPADASGGRDQTGAQLVVAVDAATELRIAQAITAPMLATVIKAP
jgi:Flp pilus assembly protein CpaB